MDPTSENPNSKYPFRYSRVSLFTHHPATSGRRANCATAAISPGSIAALRYAGIEPETAPVNIANAMNTSRPITSEIAVAVHVLNLRNSRAKRTSQARPSSKAGLPATAYLRSDSSRVVLQHRQLRRCANHSRFRPESPASASEESTAPAVLQGAPPQA